MRASIKFLIAALAISVLASACGSSSSSSSKSVAPSSQPSSATAPSGSTTTLVKSVSNSRLGGTILVTARGLTLYRLSGEQGGKFICTSSACLAAWHPLVAPAGAMPHGTVGSLSVIKRPDGTEQVTYKGMPLYTFAADRAPGQANGQGLKDVGTWNAVTITASKASAAASAPAPAPAPPPSTSSSSGGYGY